MGMNVNHVTYSLVLVITWLGSRQAVCAAQQASFPECTDSEIPDSCELVPNCTSVPISFTLNGAGYSTEGLYSTEAVVCIDPSQPHSYLLTGCPGKFFDPGQDPRGICSITSDIETGLLFRTNELELGLHPLDCWNDSSNSIIPISAIVAGSTAPFRDVLTYINGVFKLHYHNATDVTINIKDNLTLVLRGVGNILNINATGNSRFTCYTNYICKMGPSDTSNRYLECSIKTPVELSDNGTALTFLLDNSEKIKVNIYVNGSSPAVSSSAIEPTATSVPTANSSDVLSLSIVPPSQTVLSTSLSDEGSRDMPIGMIIGVTAAVAILAIVLLVVCIGIGYRLQKRSRVRTKKSQESSLRSTEEGSAAATRTAPPISSSSSSSLRSAVTPVDGQQPNSSRSNTLDRRLTDLHDKVDKVNEKVDKVDEKVEGIDTSINAMIKDNVNSFKRQNSAS